MRNLGPVAALAAAVSLLAAAPIAAQAAPVGPGQMTLIRKAVTFQIQVKTDKTPAGLRLSCQQRSPYVRQCKGSWRDRRSAYEGRVIVADSADGTTYDIAFAGIRTDRACAAKKSGTAKRLCRDAYYF